MARPYAATDGRGYGESLDCMSSTVRVVNTCLRLYVKLYLFSLGVQGDSHKFKTFLPLADNQLDETASSGKVSSYVTFLFTVSV